MSKTKEKKRRFRHITYNDRLTIERMLKQKYSKDQIAAALGFSRRTIYYEVKRSTYEHTNKDLTTEIRYNPDGAQAKYDEMLTKKGSEAKLATDSKLNNYIRDLILMGYSPEACLFEIRKNPELNFDADVKSVNTIYRAIRKGLIKDVSMKTLPRHGKGIKKKEHVTVQKRASSGTSIEKRPDEVDTREVFGHWEMDCVIGQKSNNKTLLVLTERKTREEIIEILKRKTTVEVVKALNRIEKRFKSDFYKVFKSITVDNGTEFHDVEGMEQALNRVGKRTDIYYCHARAPQERGSNENNNHFVRRFFPKGSDFDTLLNRTNIKDAEWWINTYPRRMFDGDNSQERFESELYAIGCRLPS